MGKKLFGGSKKGRFASGKGSAPARQSLPEQEPELEEELLDTAPEQVEEELEQLTIDMPEETPAEQPQEEAAALEEFGGDLADELEEPEQVKEQYEALPQEPEKKGKKKAKKQKGSRLKILAWLLAFILFIEAAYCVVIFTDLIPPIAKLRTIYIETAMSTMRHQWLAKALIPGDIVQEVIDEINAGKQAQVGVNSGWEDVTEATEETKSPSSGFSKEAAATMLSQLAQDIGLNSAEEDFFELFHELDEESTRAYAEAHPEVIANGWENYLVNEAGLDDSGTSIKTIHGDQVLAIDAANGLLVIQVNGSTYQSVMVIGKDASRLKCAPSSQWGSIGERCGVIAENNNGLVGITGSGFGDAEWLAEGADQAGGAMFSGVAKGRHYPWGYKRVELHKDNRLYIVDAASDYSEDCTDATEWTPALIVDGVMVVKEDNGGYTALNPRACIGQTKDEAIMFLVVEGRLWDSVGCDAEECAEIMAKYGAYQAMNVDGGTSAILWYQGEYITRCSNTSAPSGRRLPNAWVYCKEPVADPA